MILGKRILQTIYSPPEISNIETKYVAVRLAQYIDWTLPVEGIMMERRFLEDLAVGEIALSPEIAVSETDIIEFARRYDPQDMHTEASVHGAFGGLIASGWHTAALVMRLLVDSHPLGGTPLLGLGVEDLRWPTPVRPGDIIKAETEVLSIARSRSKPDYGIVRLKVTARNQHGEVVYVVTPSLWVPRRNA